MDYTCKACALLLSYGPFPHVLSSAGLPELGSRLANLTLLAQHLRLDRVGTLPADSLQDIPYNVPHALPLSYSSFHYLALFP